METDLQVGDIVWRYDYNTNNVVPRTIKKFHTVCGKEDKLFALLSDGWSAVCNRLYKNKVDALKGAFAHTSKELALQYKTIHKLQDELGKISALLEKEKQK